MSPTLVVILSALGVLTTVYAQQIPPKPGQVFAKDGSGVFGYKDTPVQPWSGYHVHDPDRPKSKRADPGKPGQPPSDAVILFDGTDLSQWQASKWKVEDGYVEVTEGNLISRDEFGDCQLHIEWQTPDPPQGEIMNRGNSGVNLMGVFEIQIYDTHSISLYPDGQAAAIYGQTPPMVNVTRPPGEWQSYDVVFLAPKYADGKLTERPRVTVFHNGVLVHHNQILYGTVTHRRLPGSYPPGKSTGPLLLGGHHNPVRFRNIWIRPL
ncbi:MAG: DUF1080 domain-containing protein [bacterium]|nr:DUF1080 domain-containing protein [bacterium]